jgi:WD40 repeat protein
MGGALRLLGRGALAIACSAIGLGIAVLISLVASRTWSWQISVAVVLGAAAVGAGADALRGHLRTDPRPRPERLERWPGDDALVERPAEKDQIVRALRGKRRRANVVVLEGVGGYGKSTLARSVATDRSIGKKFSGVYLVRCGEDAVTDFAIAGVVNGLLEDITGRRPGYTDPQTAGQHLGQVLGQLGKILLLVDNVWTQQQVLPFLVGARKCTRLVTTRMPDLPLTGATRVNVGPMSAVQSRELLLRGLAPDQAVLVEADLLEEVISRTWHWPLLLGMLNKALLTRVREGRAPDAALRGILECISARGPQGADKLDVGLGLGTQSVLVESTLDAGLPLLRAPDAKHRLLDLAVFPPRALVPVKVVSGLWVVQSSLSEAEATSLLSRMAGLSFFTISRERVQLHDVMHEFLRRQVDELARAELAGLLVDLLARLVPTVSSGPDGDRLRPAWWDGGACADYIGSYVVQHLMEAGRRQAAEDLVCDLRWVLYRLQGSGTAAVLADLALVDTDRARRLGGAIERVAHMLGEERVRPDAGQFLLNSLRTEPEWAEQVPALLAGRSEPMLVSQWPLPDNPGPALMHVYKIPSAAEWSDAAALSPDGSWLAIAGDAGVFTVDTSTGLVTAAYRPDQRVNRIAIAPDGRRMAILAAGAGALTVYDTAAGSVLAQGRDYGGLRSIAFAPDGASLVTAGNDGRVKLWDALTGQWLREDAHAFSPYSGDSLRGSMDAVVSDDGKWVVSGGQGERIFLWSMPEGQLLETLGFGSLFGLVEHVTVAPDRGWVAGSAGLRIYVWSTQTGELVTTLEAGGRVTALAVTRDGSRLAGGIRGGTLLVWECRGFTLEARLDRHVGVRSLGFSPDGQVLYSGGGGEAKAWDLRQAASLGSSGESAAVERVLMSPQGTWAAVAVHGGDVHIRNLASGQVEATLTGHRFSVRDMAVAPDGTWLATESGGYIFVWDTTGWTLTRKLYVGNVTSEISDLLASADGRRLLTVDGMAVRAWDPGSGLPLTGMTSLSEQVGALSFSRDGSWLAAGDYYGTIWVWDTESGKLLSTVGGGDRYAPLEALAATPDNTLLAYPSATGYGIATWDVHRAESVKVKVFRPGRGADVAISPDGLSAMTCEENTVKYHDLASSREEALRRGDAALAFSGDSRWFAIGARDVTEVRDRSTRRVHAEVDRRPGDQRYGSPPSAMALTLRGDRLASARGDRLVIWDTATSQVLREFTLRNGYASAVAISPDGGRVGISCGDRITILDTASGEERELAGNLGPVQGAAASPEGRYVAIAASAGVRVWDASSGRPVAVLQERGDVSRLLFGPREEWLAVAGNSAIEIFSVPQAERLKAFPYPLAGQELIRDMAVAPDGTRIVVRDSAGNLFSIDLESDRMDALADAGWRAIDVMMVSPDGKWLATGGEDLSVRRLRDGSLVATHGMNRPVKSLDWSPDSDGIVAGGDGGVYYLLFKNQPE